MIHNIFLNLRKKYKIDEKTLAIEQRAGLDVSPVQVLKRRFKIYLQSKTVISNKNIYCIFKRKSLVCIEHIKAFQIGKRAAQGYNIYLTFGSDKTVTKDAEDSYKRYAMAMKHYNQAICDRDSFLLGYEKFTKLNI